MAAPPKRVDVVLHDLQAEAAASINAGEAVALSSGDGECVACSTADGRLLGTVPAEQAAQLRRGSFSGSVRTVRRQQSGGAVAAVEVRFAAVDAAAQARVQQAQHRQEEDEVDEGSWRLTNEQLEALAADEEVRWMLRDERLQVVVRDTDGAADRERALIRALQAPNFNEFADKEGSSNGAAPAKGKGGTSGIGSGVKLENVAITFKNQQVLRDVSWEVKKGERVGLVGVNGAGKTTQLQIITGRLAPDAGEVLRAKEGMKIAYLNQARAWARVCEFDVEPSRTVREEFMSAFGEQVEFLIRQEEIQHALEKCGEDMEAMAQLLDDLSELQSKSVDLDISLLDKKIDQVGAFTFPPVERMGQVAARVEGLTHGYAGRTLFKNANLTIERGERVAIIGPNGAGKSTLLRLIMGREKPVSGRCELGPHHIVPNYFEQNQAEALDLKQTVIETLEGSVIAVSHDRYFLKRIATRVVEVKDGRLVDYQGDYEVFLEENEVEAEQMAVREERQREIEKSQIKAKSKMSKAEKARQKKDKAKAFNQGQAAAAGAGKPAKDAKR
eukprot:scaffold17.g425.t1